VQTALILVICVVVFCTGYAIAYVNTAANSLCVSGLIAPVGVMTWIQRGQADIAEKRLAAVINAHLIAGIRLRKMRPLMLPHARESLEEGLARAFAWREIKGFHRAQLAADDANNWDGAIGETIDAVGGDRVRKGLEERIAELVKEETEARRTKNWQEGSAHSVPGPQSPTPPPTNPPVSSRP